MKKPFWSIFCFVICVISIPVAFAGSVETTEDKVKDLASRVRFVSPDATDTLKTNQGFWVTFNAPLIDTLRDDVKAPKTSFFSMTSQYYAFVTLNGYNMNFTNASSKPILIRWRESSISIGEFSYIPIVSGMSYENANSTRVPDTLIAPGETLTLNVYLGRINSVQQTRLVGSHYDFLFDEWVNTYEKYLTYYVVGEPIPDDGNINFTLLLRVFIDNRSIFFTINPPLTGLTGR